MLNRITARVHANKSTVFSSMFESAIDLPIDLSGGKRISAAIPAFQPSPIEVSTDDVK